MPARRPTLVCAAQHVQPDAANQQLRNLTIGPCRTHEGRSASGRVAPCLRTSRLGRVDRSGTDDRPEETFQRAGDGVTYFRSMLDAAREPRAYGETCESI